MVTIRFGWFKNYFRARVRLVRKGHAYLDLHGTHDTGHCNQISASSYEPHSSDRLVVIWDLQIQDG